MKGADEPSDEEVVRRVRAGDAEAAADLFDRHLPKLRAAARKRIPAAMRAKVAESDVIQETYLAAFIDLARFEDRGDGSFARWLRGILENKIAYEVRRFAAGKRDAHREVRLPSTDEPRAGRRASASSTPSAVAAAAEERARMREVVAKLPDDYRTIVRLVHEEGLTLVEAGRRMDRSADAARMLYSRAMGKVAEALPGKGR